MTGRVQEWQQEPQFHGQWDCGGQQFFGVIEESRKELRSPRLFIVMIRAQAISNSRMATSTD